MIIREAVPDEADLLSELALRSKAHWGYSDEFIDACREELKVGPDQCHNHYCAVDDGQIVGFYGLVSMDDGSAELDALFVEPSRIGQGIGKVLVKHTIETASHRGASRLLIEGDPNAEAFYLAAGAKQIGKRPSGSIPGRQLPLFEIQLKA